MYIQGFYIVRDPNMRTHTEIAIVGPGSRALNCIYRVNPI